MTKVYLSADTNWGVTRFTSEADLIDGADIKAPVPYLAPGDFYAILPALENGEQAFTAIVLADDGDRALWQAIQDDYGTINGSNEE